MTARQAAESYRKIGGEVRRAIESTAAAALKMPEVRAVWLFGSYAAGNAGPDSDIDVAFVLGSIEDCGLPGYRKLAKLGIDTGLDMQIQLVAAQEMEAPCGIVEEIANNGFNLDCVVPALRPESKEA